MCNAELAIGNGEDEIVFYCCLEAGHKGRHQEEGTPNPRRAYQPFIPWTMTWENEDDR
jgi:hypothetical protein